MPRLPQEDQHVSLVIERIEELVRRDPARRGLNSPLSRDDVLCPCHLEQSASHLAVQGRHAAIVTGFFIPDAEPPAAETDGPPGSLHLAKSLEQAGITATIHTDAHCAGAVDAAAKAAGFPSDQLFVHDCHPDADMAAVLGGNSEPITHLLAVERVGPCHTPESLSAQRRTGLAPLDAFLSAVPDINWNRCHNMRGRMIDDVTSPLHRLFEELPTHRPEAKTIGVGDGGNEIGMGGIPWEVLCERLNHEQAAAVPCRIATDWTIIAGTSNWGAYALAAAVLLKRGMWSEILKWSGDAELGVIDAMVKHGPAVDGVTKRREATVDGLPAITYIQALEGIRRIVAEAFAVTSA
jgi:D-glutamate cyclase